MPEINGPVKISHVPPWLDGRTPYGKHHFAGANVFMLKMLRNNIQTLSLTADIQHFDSSIQRTYDNLQLRTLNLSLTEVNRTDDSLYIDVKIENMAGHKLPSAYPSRRVFVELIGVADSGDTLFHSGKMDHNFNIIDEDPDYEPHHNIIDMQEKVQIYEMVMANVNGDVTTVLERAYEHLKDNRIPPLGFQIAHQSYDTIQIIGHAIMDDDFNAIDGEEGNGADVIHYQMGVDQSIEDISITTNVYYQTVSLKWLQQMFEYSSSDIDLFKSLYETSDRAPVLLAQSVITSQAVAVDEEESLPEFSLYPNPSKGSFTIIHTQDIHEIQVVSTYGKVIYTHRSEQNPIRRLTIDLEVENGLYFIVSTNPTGRQVRKLIIS